MEEEKKHTSKLKKHISLADWHDCMLIYHAMCQSHHKVNKNEIVHILKSVEIIYKKNGLRIDFFGVPNSQENMYGPI